jgi:hypothetical protein
MIKLRKEPFDGRDVESVLVITPKNLVPCGRCAIKQALWCDRHPLATVVERDERQEMLACVCIPQKRAAVVAR